MNRMDANRRLWAPIFCVFFAATASSATGAEAQSAQLNHFRPSETPTDLFAAPTAETRGHLNLGAQLYIDYANDPLVWEGDQGDRGSERLQIVEHQLTANFLASFSIYERATFFLGLPVIMVMNGEDPSIAMAPVAEADGGGIGDMYLGGRVRLYGENDEGFQLAFQGTLTFPLAEAADGGQAYSGQDSVSFHPEALVGFRHEVIRVAFALGTRIRENQDFGTLNQNDELTFDLGVGVPFMDGQIEAIAELNGSTNFKEFFAREETWLELIGGAKYHHPEGYTAGVGLGPGLTRGFGTPDIRFFAMFGYSRQFEPEERASVEGEQVSAAPGDRDRDGLLDEVDQCPDDPEDLDAFEDEDGCPDPDNDQDTVLDAADGAPLDPEDHDGFQDDDGVPDPDNDQDGLLDGDDRCPNEPGPQENRGCPDTDRDEDTVVDRVDNCPDEPGPPENQGCAEEQLVVIEADQIRILDTIYFRTNRDVIRRRSYALLDNVASVLVAHPEIERVRIEGHTDARGRDSHNMELSQRRAEAVVQYLVDKGIDASRLAAIGYGETRPVVEDARTRDEHAQNRRVEFHIGSDVEGVEQRSSGPTDDTIDP